MATKNQLYDALAKLTEENAKLRSENEVMHSALVSIYLTAKQASGIEAAIAEREALRLRNQLPQQESKP